MIELRHLCAQYQKKTALHDVSLSLFPGEVLVLIGPNGCGKSTLIKSILGLHHKSSGEILFDGIPIEYCKARELAKKVSYLAQERSVPNIDVRRMVLHGRFPYLGYPRRYSGEDYRIAEQAMERTGAAAFGDKLVTELSGGERQKVYLAMALAQCAGTVLMDEPTTYLDIRYQLGVMQTVRELADEGICVVMVLHDIAAALRCADRIAVMQKGQIVQVGTPENIYQSKLLDEVFGITLCRTEISPGDWQYYYK